MKVKCKYCKQTIERDSAYRVDTENGHFYCCSEAEHRAVQKAKADKDAVYNEICNIFGYKLQNSALWKEWAEWSQLADNEKILGYIKENQDYIKNAIGRLSGTEYGKVRYMSAMLKNNLHDYKEKKIVEIDKITAQGPVPDEDYIMVSKKNKMVSRRRGFGEEDN